MSAPKSLEQEVAEAALINSAALEKAAAILDQQAREDAEVARLLPRIAELTVKIASIEPEEREAFAAAVGSSRVKLAQAYLYTLEQVAEKLPAAQFPGRQVDGNGRAPGQSKQASHRGYVGAGAGLEAANRAFDEALGFNG